MRKFGKLLMILGAATGAAVVGAIFGHLGVFGVPWLVNVALAKLGLISSAALMAGGAMSVRMARRLEQRQLNSGATNQYDLSHGNESE